MRSVQVRRGAYVDSVTLMQVSRRVGALDGRLLIAKRGVSHTPELL